MEGETPMSLNQILLIGNAGRDAELRYTQNGAAVANFSMAVNRRYQVRNETREDTEWFNVAAWERQAEWVSESVKRGTRVFVDGRLATREYTSGNGEMRVSLEVNARRVIPLTVRGNGNDEDGERERYPRRDDDHEATSDEPATTVVAEDTPNPTDETDNLENLPW